MAEIAKSDIDAVSEEVVSLMVQEVLTAEAVMPGAVMDYSAQVGPGMDLLKIPKFQSFTVADVSDSADLTPATNTFSTDDLPLSRHKGIGLSVSAIASLQSKVDAISYYLEQTAKDLAQEMDQAIIDEAELTSASSPDHRIVYDNNGSDNNLQKVDILEAIRLLNVQKVPQTDRFMLVGPGSWKSLLNISEFIRADESGTNALQTGQIGKLFGLTCLMSPLAEDLKTLVFHRTHVAFARQKQVTVMREQRALGVKEDISVSHLYGKKVLDAGKRGVLLGTAS